MKRERWVSSKGSVSFVEVIQGIERYLVMQLLILEENWYVLSLSLSLLYTHTNTNTNRWVSKIHLRVYLQVEKKMDLVYGGGSVGLMGLVSQTVFDGGCHVLG